MAVTYFHTKGTKAPWRNGWFLVGAERVFKTLEHLCLQFSSVQFIHSVMPNSLWPHELQHTRPPCLSSAPGACSNSCLSSRWCHPTISSSEMRTNHLIFCRPLLLLISLSHHPGLFQWVSSLHQVAKVLELQLQHESFPSVLPMHWQAGSLPLAAPGKFIYTWSCVKQIAVGNWLHSTRSSAWCAMKT